MSPAPWKEIVDFLEEVGLSATHNSLLNICVSRRHFLNLPRKRLEIAMDGMNDPDIERYMQRNLVCRSFILSLFTLYELSPKMDPRNKDK